MVQFLEVSAVPRMSSNTAPSGIASSSSQFNTDFSAWKAFDGASDSFGWASVNNIFPHTLTYQFASPIAITAYVIKSRNSAPSDVPPQAARDWTLEASANGTDWIVLDTQISQTAWAAGERRLFWFENSVKYLYYRLKITANNGSTVTAVGELELYEYQEKIVPRASSTSVPFMTSNTDPSGQAFASSIYSTTYDAWRAFNGTVTGATDCWASAAGMTTGFLGYKFTSPISIASYVISSRDEAATKDTAPKTWTFEGSSDGQSWTVLDTQNHLSIWFNKEEKEFILKEDKIGAYLYYRLNITAPYSTSFGYVSVGELKLLQYKPNQLQYSTTTMIPKMTSNTAPRGIVTADSNLSSDFPYKAFDGSTSTSGRNFWYTNSAKPSGGHWINYRFVNPVAISKISLQGLDISGGSYSIKNFTLYGSLDGVSYTKLYSNVHPNSSAKSFYLFYNTVKYTHYKLQITDSYYEPYAGIVEMEMFEYVSGKPDFADGPLALREIVYVSKEGDDVSGDGSVDRPFASLYTAVNYATTGMGIKIGAGEFDINTAFPSLAGSYAGIWDMNKNLAIAGEDNQTIIKFSASVVTASIRDVAMVCLGNALSTLSNMRLQYTPNRTSNSYNSSIFLFSLGSFYNIWFEKLGAIQWSYNYHNSPPALTPVIENCIFSAPNNSTSDFSGNASYKNCIFKNLPSSGTKTYYLIRNPVEQDYNVFLDPIPADALNMGDPAISNKKNGTRSNIGVRGGRYQWYSVFLPAEVSFPTWGTIKLPTQLPTSIYVKPSGIMTGVVNISPLYFNSFLTNIQVKNVSQLFTSFTVPPYNKMEATVDIIQPPRTVVKFNSNQDAFTRKNVPRLNYGTEQEMLIGGNESGDEFKSYIQFDISSLPPQQKVTSAILNLYYEKDGENEEYFRIKKLVDSWSEMGITRLNSPVGTSVEFYGLTPSKTGYVQIDLTNLVKDWYQDLNQNCGVLIEVAQTSVDIHRFSTRERSTNKPYLEVEYYDPAIKSFDQSDVSTFISVRQNENLQMNTNLTVISKYREFDLGTKIHALNQDMVETFVTTQRDFIVSTIQVRRTTNVDVPINLSIQQKASSDTPILISSTRPFLICKLTVRRRESVDIPANITIRKSNSTSIPSAISISNPTMPTNGTVYYSKNINTYLTVVKPSEKDLKSQITAIRKEQQELPITIQVWKNAEIFTHVNVLSGYLATKIIVPFKQDHNIKTRMSVQEKFAQDMLTRIGAVSNTDIEIELEVVEDSGNKGFILFL